MAGLLPYALLYKNCIRTLNPCAEEQIPLRFFVRFISIRKFGRPVLSIFPKRKEPSAIRGYNNEVLTQRTTLSFGLFYAIILFTDKSEL